MSKLLVTFILITDLLINKAHTHTLSRTQITIINRLINPQLTHSTIKDVSYIDKNQENNGAGTGSTDPAEDTCATALRNSILDPRLVWP